MPMTCKPFNIYHGKYEELKRRLFVATVELINDANWALTSEQDVRLDGWMLHHSVKDGYKFHMEVKLWGNLPKLSSKIRARRLLMAGHRVKHEDPPVVPNMARLREGDRR